MKESQIQSFLNKLNNNQYSKTIFKHQIGVNVDYAKVWESIKSTQQKPHSFFFIKSNDKYVGAVLDMYDDLHWYMLPNYRGKGHLTIALKKIILPYIFDVLERDSQIISITESQIGTTNYKKSIKVALSVGFKKLEEDKLELSLKDLDKAFDKTKATFNGLSDNEVDTINNELDFITKRLNQINAQIDNAFGKDIYDYTNNPLKELSITVSNHKYIIQDIISDFNDLKG